MTLYCSCIIQIFFLFFFLFVLTCNLPLVFFFFLFFFGFVLVSCPYPSTMPRKTRAHRTASSPSKSPFQSELFQSEKNKELYETLNIKRKIWAERKVLLDQLDSAIRVNFECKGWLPLLDIGHPPPVALIREFYSNISIHIYDSNTLVKSWIRGVEFTITSRAVANALEVPMVLNPIYPYDGSPPLNDIMS